MAKWTRESYGRLSVEPDGKNGFSLTGFKSVAETGCALAVLANAYKAAEQRETEDDEARSQRDYERRMQR